MKKEEALKALEKKLKMIIVHQQEIQEVKPNRWIRRRPVNGLKES